MTDKTLYTRIAKRVREGLNEVEALRKQLLELQEAMESNDYSQEYKAKQHTEASGLRLKIQVALDSCSKACAEICNEYADDLRDMDSLKGAEINDDYKLLQLGLSLSKNDILSMIRRNSENRTMLQLIFRYADENGIETGMRYAGVQNKMEKIHIATEAVRVTLKWWEDPSVGMYDKLIGEGSQFHAAFADDSDESDESIVFTQAQVNDLLAALRG